MNSTTADLARVLLVSISALSIPHSAFATETDRTELIDPYMEAVGASLRQAQKDALLNIENKNRRNLAMTYYLRAGETISLRWSWSRAEIKAYENSSEFIAAVAEIDKVSRRFAAENSQHKLYANTQIRSLEEQLRRWQEVRSVGVAADQLHKASLSHLQQHAYAAIPDKMGIERFKHFLASWRAPSPPTLAAPGLSLHGRGRAYDFQVQDQSGRLIASADTSKILSIWERQGWTERLSRAVHSASDKFIGPLHGEPWHYEYRP